MNELNSWPPGVPEKNMPAFLSFSEIEKVNGVSALDI